MWLDLFRPKREWFFDKAKASNRQPNHTTSDMVLTTEFFILQAHLDHPTILTDRPNPDQTRPNPHDPRLGLTGPAGPHQGRQAIHVQRIDLKTCQQQPAQRRGTRRRGPVQRARGARDAPDEGFEGTGLTWELAWASGPKDMGV